MYTSQADLDCLVHFTMKDMVDVIGAIGLAATLKKLAEYTTDFLIPEEAATLKDTAEMLAANELLRNS